MKLLAISALLMVVPSILGENIFLNNLKPEEAQKYITQTGLGLKYAPKIGENPLSQSRNSYGGGYYQGRKISNPNDYVEDHYLANQFHGQDGLGRALFGYSDWNQGRVEAINGNGHVRGSYKYVDPYGKDFVANYWSDGLGFHQEDNRPKVVLEPVTDTPAVQHARQEHFRKWHEAAEQARASPDPNSDVYNRDANRWDEDQDRIDQALEITGGVSNQHQSLTRYPNLSYNKQVTPDRDYSASSLHDTVTINRDDARKYNRNYEPEPTGPPHGFYYNFDYPVQLLRKIKDSSENSNYGAQYNSYDNTQYNPTGYSKNYNSATYNPTNYNPTTDYSKNYNPTNYNPTNQNPTNYNQNYNKNYNQEAHSNYKRSSVEAQVAAPAVKAAEEATPRIDAVHDSQVHPKQRAALDAQTA